MVPAGIIQPGHIDQAQNKPTSTRSGDYPNAGSHCDFEIFQERCCRAEKFSIANDEVVIPPQDRFEIWLDGLVFWEIWIGKQPGLLA